MVLRAWDELPDNMKNDGVRKYYDILYEERFSLFAKRIFDIAAAVLILIILLPAFLLIAAAIKKDTGGPVMFRQVRVTQYGKRFLIFKFRTMVINAERIGSQVTAVNDGRVTRVGRFLRKYRLDEIPQLFNIITGDMSFVGTRPEVAKYVEGYTDEMRATLLLSAGITSEASIQYKDEERLLSGDTDTDKTYVEVVLPGKMEFNLRSIEEFSFLGEIRTMFKTVLSVAYRDNASREAGYIGAAIEKRKSVYEAAN